MDKFTVAIYFKNHKCKIIMDACSVSYAEGFINNKWKLILDVAKNIDSKPEYFSYHANVINQVLIMNKKRIIVVDKKLKKEYDKKNKKR